MKISEARRLVSERVWSGTLTEMLLLEGYAVQGEWADVTYHTTLRDAIHKILKSLE